MCEPVSLSTLMYATIGMSALSAGAGVLGQAAQYNANKANAEQSFRIQNQQTNLAIQQQEAADSVKAQETQRQMLIAGATAKASANESGTSGNSIDGLINDYFASEGRYLSNLNTQQKWNRAQADLEKKGQAAQGQARVNSVAQPDFLGAALRIGGDALNTYTDLYAKRR